MRPRDERPPFQGRGGLAVGSQGFALGWWVSPLRGDADDGARCGAAASPGGTPAGCKASELSRLWRPEGAATHQPRAKPLGKALGTLRETIAAPKGREVFDRVTSSALSRPAAASRNASELSRSAPRRGVSTRGVSGGDERRPLQGRGGLADGDPGLRPGLVGLAPAGRCGRRCPLRRCRIARRHPGGVQCP